MKFQFAFILLFLVFIQSCKVADPNAQSKTEVQPTIDPVKEVDSVSKSIPIIESSDATYREAQEQVHDIIHTRLEVSFDWDKQQVIGKAILEVKPYFYPTDDLELDAVGFEIKAVKLINGLEESPLEFDYDDEVLEIALDTIYDRNSSFTVSIDYVANPGELESNGSTAITDDRGLYFINPTGTEIGKPQQIWTQGETQANSAWFPTIDAPNEKFTQEILITVNQRFSTLSNGSLIYSLINEDSTRTDYWKMDKPHAAYLVMLAVGEYAKVEDNWENEVGENVPVDYYVEEMFAPHAKAIFGNTPEMMSFFSQILNYPYPWSKYSQIVVRDFVSGAMENTTASVFMDDLQITSEELIDYNWDDIIAHELFHHWFGNLVTCESWSNLPLNESFATYGEYLWYEYKYGKEEADYHHWDARETYLLEAEEKKEDLIRFYYDEHDDMFDSHSYQKGSIVLHMLRRYVGDEAFFEALNLYLTENAFENVEIHHLRLAFEKVVGEDLNWFFNQWFLAAGHPKLEITHQQSDGLLTVNINQTQNLDSFPVFKIPTEIAIWTSEEDVVEFPVVISANQEEFVFEVDRPVKLILLDPERHLLAEVNHQKSIDELIFQYYIGEHLIARYESLSKLGEMAYNVPEAYDTVTTVFINAMQEDPFWGIRELAAEYFDEYEGSYDEFVEKGLLDLALNDKKSQVRASALTSLISFDPDKHKATYLKLLEDSSYMVKGTAILGFTATDDPNKEKVLSQFKSSDNIHIIFALAEYYAEDHISGENKWFVEKLNNMDAENKFYLIQYYGIFLSESSQETQNEGMNYLKGVAINDPTPMIRFAGYQTLSLLPESETLIAIKAEIIANEKDERLKSMYKSMQ